MTMQLCLEFIGGLNEKLEEDDCKKLIFGFPVPIGAGEVNDGENCLVTPGAVGTYKGKDGPTLQFKGFKGGSGVVVTATADEICIEGQFIEESTIVALPKNIWTKVPVVNLTRICSFTVYDSSGEQIEVAHRLTAPDCLEICSVCDLANVDVCLVGD